MVQTLLRDGKTYTIRPDITTLLMHQWIPLMKEQDQLRVFYMSHHYRQRSVGLIDTEECGFEVYGSFDAFQPLQMLQTITNVLKKPLTLVVGFPPLLASFLDDSRTPLSHEQRYAIQSKSGREINRLFSPDREKKLTPFLRVYDSLSPLQTLVDSKTFHTLATVASACPNITIHYDLSMIPDFNYYSGLYIKGFLPGYAQPVLFGGSYDNRTNQFGALKQAFGLSFDMKMLYQEVRL
jgi:ATP phosphoribosyltransferase regulatory subunit HisZ